MIDDAFGFNPALSTGLIRCSASELDAPVLFYYFFILSSQSVLPHLSVISSLITDHLSETGGRTASDDDFHPPLKTISVVVDPPLVHHETQELSGRYSEGALGWVHF